MECVLWVFWRKWLYKELWQTDSTTFLRGQWVKFDSVKIIRASITASHLFAATPPAQPTAWLPSPRLSTTTGESRRVSWPPFTPTLPHRRLWTDPAPRWLPCSIPCTYIRRAVTMTSLEQHGISNYWQLDCLCNNLFMLTTKKTAHHYWSFTRGIHSQRASNVESIYMSWHHHGFNHLLPQGIPGPVEPHLGKIRPRSSNHSYHMINPYTYGYCCISDTPVCLMSQA